LGRLRYVVENDPPLASRVRSLLEPCFQVTLGSVQPGDSLLALVDHGVAGRLLALLDGAGAPACTNELSGCAHREAVPRDSDFLIKEPADILTVPHDATEQRHQGRGPRPDRGADRYRPNCPVQIVL